MFWKRYFRFFALEEMIRFFVVHRKSHRFAQGVQIHIYYILLRQVQGHHIGVCNEDKNHLLE